MIAKAEEPQKKQEKDEDEDKENVQQIINNKSESN